jgi:mannose-1-phosphate guanylyltransferase
MEERDLGHMGEEEIFESGGKAINSKQLWSIILAGGNGDRISEFTRRWKGRSIPKQYCAFIGTQSMLQHTLLRADKLGQPTNQLTLIARAHQREAQPQLTDRWPRA